MSERKPNRYVGLDVHCSSCGRFLARWVRSTQWPACDQPPLMIKFGKDVQIWSGRSAEARQQGGGSVERTQLDHECRAKGRKLSTVVSRDRVAAILQEIYEPGGRKILRVDW